MTSKPNLGGAEKKKKKQQIDSIFFLSVDLLLFNCSENILLWVSICICMSVCIYIYLYREKSYTTGLAFIKCSSGVCKGREQNNTATDEL